jgi:hypothetical protein
VLAQGGLAPIQLVPGSATGAPTSGTHALGELYVDSDGVLYRCVTAGTPGTWAPLYSTVPLASPIRVINSQNGTGGITGPIGPSKVYTSSDITGGSSGIPPAAIAVVGTLTMLAGSPTGRLIGVGHLTAFPGGTALPATSNVNASTSYAIASGITVALGSGAHAGQVSVEMAGTSQPVHVFLDVAAYII